MKSPPGWLQPIYQQNHWLDLVLKSDLSPNHKLVAVVVSRTCSYNKYRKLSLSNVSPYSISRIIHTNQEEVEAYLDDLIELGWLFDTGYREGARRIYTTTFSLIPGKLRS